MGAPTKPTALSSIIGNWPKINNPLSESLTRPEVPTTSKVPTINEVSTIPEVPTEAKSVKSQSSLLCPDGGACYLLYDPDSSGQLVEHYVKSSVDFAIGRWIPGSGKKIAGFKFK